MVFEILITLILLVLTYWFMGFVTTKPKRKKAPDNLHIYVDVTNGSDDNTGSKFSPLQTLARALQLANCRGWNKTATIHLADGTYVVEEDLLTFSWNNNNGLQQHALKVGGDNSKTLVENATVTSVIAGPANLVRIGLDKTVTNADVQGAFVTFFTGKVADLSAVIGWVDETTKKELVLASTELFDAAPGDRFNITIPTATIGFKIGIFFTSPLPVILRNVNFALNAVDDSLKQLVIFGPGEYGMSGVRFLPPSSTSSGAFGYVGGSTIITGSSLKTIPGVTDDQAMGISVLGTLGTSNIFLLNVGSAPVILDNSLLRNAFMQGQGGTTTFNSSVLNVAPIIAQENSMLIIQATWSLNSFLNGITLLDGSNLELHNSDISGALGNGVDLDDSKCTIQETTTDPLNKNAGVGLNIGPISCAKVQIATTTLTGTAVPSDVKVGSLPPSIWTTAQPRDDWTPPLPATVYACYAAV